MEKSAEDNRHIVKSDNAGDDVRVKIAVDGGSFALALVCVAFVVIKIYSPTLSRYIGIMIAAVALTMFLKCPKLRAGWLSIGALSLDDLVLGISITFFFIYYIFCALKKNRINRAALLVICSCLTLLALTLFTGGVMIDNLTRFLSMLIPVLLIFEFLPSLRLNQNHGISLVYYILISGQILFLSLESSDRMSIFNGSENIAFIIFAVMLYTINITSVKYYLKIFSVLIFCIFVLMTDSRTGFFLSFFLLGWLLSKGMSIKVIGVYLLGLAFCAYLLGWYLEVDRGDFSRYMGVVDYLLAGEIGLDSLAVLDVRGEVFAEGLDVWRQNPFFGVGAHPSAVLQNIFGNGATHEFHNIFIDILVQYGLFGLVLVVLNFLVILGRINSQLPPSAMRDIRFLFGFYLLFAMFQPLVFNYQALIILFISVSCIHINHEIKKDLRHTVI